MSSCLRAEIREQASDQRRRRARQRKTRLASHYRAKVSRERESAPGGSLARATSDLARCGRATRRGRRGGEARAPRAAASRCRPFPPPIFQSVDRARRRICVTISLSLSLSLSRGARSHLAPLVSRAKRKKHERLVLPREKARRLVKMLAREWSTDRVERECRGVCRAQPRALCGLAMTARTSLEASYGRTQRGKTHERDAPTDEARFLLGTGSLSLSLFGPVSGTTPRSRHLWYLEFAVVTEESDLHEIPLAVVRGQRLQERLKPLVTFRYICRQRGERRGSLLLSLTEKSLYLSRKSHSVAISRSPEIRSKVTSSSAMTCGYPLDHMSSMQALRVGFRAERY